MHLQSKQHRLAKTKLKTLTDMSLSLWERHRGAPLNQESAHEGDFQDEFAKYQKHQQRREEALIRESWHR